MTDLPSSVQLAVPSFRHHATVLKMAAVAFLGLLLLVPLVFVHSVLEDRLARRNDAVREVTATWGSGQVVVGPVLAVPYRQTRNEWKEQTVDGRVERVETGTVTTEHAYFLPQELKADGRLEPSRLSRGIYESVVYTGTLRVTGTFAKPSFAAWSVDPQQILWGDAEMTLAVTDLRGAREALAATIGGAAVPL